MKVLDLFAGLRGWSDPWKARGHEVVTLDNDPSFRSDLVLDMVEFVQDFDKYLHGWRPDVILASPPCEAFSVMTIGRNWTMDHQPKTDKARLALELVGHTTYAIRWLRPCFFVIENPRAKLRRLSPVTGLDRVTVTYCQYGEPFMKPTDLWGGFPPSWVPRPPCKNGAPCHISAARGSRTGIQGEAVRAARQAIGKEHLSDMEDEYWSNREGGESWGHPSKAIAGRRTEATRNMTLEEAIARMAAKPPTSRTKFKGGMIEVMSRFPSWSEERKSLSALRAKIPEQLSTEICEAAERDL
jgi:hypothetical protein